MLRLLKWTFILAFVLALAGAFWVAFALWTGIYSVYSYPPSRIHPDGVTLLVSREPGEPMFNSPDYVPPAVKPGEPQKGTSFQSIPKSRRPLEKRTVVELPYIDWAYEKSIEPPEAE
jgi:hypothetical protein